MSTGTFTPKPGAAPLPRMIAAQAGLETRMLLRNGEQLLLTIIIPTLLLVLFSAVDVISLPTGTGSGPAAGWTSSPPASWRWRCCPPPSPGRPSPPASNAATASSSGWAPLPCHAGG